MFPKGHVEERETVEQTAVCEVGEEVGADAVVVGKIGATDYRVGGEPASVAHLLMRYRGVNEGRERLGCSARDARARLTYDNLSQQLDPAEAASDGTSCRGDAGGS